MVASLAERTAAFARCACSWSKMQFIVPISLPTVARTAARVNSASFALALSAADSAAESVGPCASTGAASSMISRCTRVSSVSSFSSSSPPCTSVRCLALRGLLPPFVKEPSPEGPEGEPPPPFSSSSPSTQSSAPLSLLRLRLLPNPLALKPASNDSILALATRTNAFSASTPASTISFCVCSNKILSFTMRCIAACSLAAIRYAEFLSARSLR
mmetsp:Transcript_17637/g.41002  ORF Transcript_17637/g.41002 Transcript_17637/m.41002 type:complete len:215 (+) Transcript_17637:1974-2618(+)